MPRNIFIQSKLIFINHNATYQKSAMNVNTEVVMWVIEVQTLPWNQVLMFFMTMPGLPVIHLIHGTYL